MTGKGYVCSVCGKTGMSARGLKLHVKLVHSVKQEGETNSEVSLSSLQEILNDKE